VTSAERLAAWTQKAEEAIACRDQAIVEMHAEGATLRAIAELAHLSHTHISNVIRKKETDSDDR
jgi:DNA-binding NarL/FixJ family response regulator